jgi:D-serine dehydratase
MKILDFKESNCVYAENQPQYLPLPCLKSGGVDGIVTFCMGLSFIERLRVLFTGKIWCNLMTFNKPLTPSFFSTKKKDCL